jgi:hypothetical protein
MIYVTYVNNQGKYERKIDLKPVRTNLPRITKEEYYASCDSNEQYDRMRDRERVQKYFNYEETEKVSMV